jgi:hypothetical protein
VQIFRKTGCLSEPHLFPDPAGINRVVAAEIKEKV